MRKLINILLILACMPAFTVFASDAPVQQKNENKVEAYYFHGTRRCINCTSVEKVTQESLKELYGNNIVLKSLVFDDASNKKLVEKYKIDGQSLIFVKGNKVVDITNDAFLNAVRRPEKLKEKIRETVASLN